MTSDQFKVLLQELAQLAGMADTTGLLEHGRVRVGEVPVVLEHDPAYDAELLQVRLLLGALPPQETDLVARALLEANYVSGYGGECVFSLMPETDDAVITMKVRLVQGLTAQELWQELSDVAHHGSRMWESITSLARPSGMLQADGLAA
ncbi:hypothetical protein [Ramlibacter albus]|uniref:Uncharacterized protein n=1 Tax=Ramlibacter albus TaxID=2079448 RepID=A0A923S1S9_9BURK|nr:hypothetical protein [Ramlibacter albus]MBC5764601.1 hypothetical protein [Ramlibacter albus]